VLCLELIVAGANAPFLAGPLEIAPIGMPGWALSFACSLLPLVVIQSWLSLSG
jgi:hypothetical protein